MTQEINQCDGCQRGLPLNRCGWHYKEGGFLDVNCTKDRYQEEKCNCQKNLGEVCPRCNEKVPETPEWEKECSCGEIALWCSFHKESVRREIINSTLEEAAEATKAALLKKARTTDYADRTEYDESADIAVETIRALKNK